MRTIQNVPPQRLRKWLELASDVPPKQIHMNATVGNQAPMATREGLIVLME